MNEMVKPILLLLAVAGVVVAVALPGGGGSRRVGGGGSAALVDTISTGEEVDVEDYVESGTMTVIEFTADW
ncbi:MAG: hypothetical protein O7C98_09585 [Planctomycetota bacterium]|nr:hypothetical protein [Planctomycetota bacterium]